MDILLKIITTIPGYIPEKIKQETYDAIASAFIAAAGGLMMNTIIGAICLWCGLVMFFYMIRSNLASLKEELTLQNTSPDESINKECYVEFSFNNGFIYTNNVNVDWAPVCNPKVDKENNAFTLSFSLKIPGKTMYFINPNNTSSHELFFKGSLAIIKLTDLNVGNYRIDFE